MSKEQKVNAFREAANKKGFVEDEGYDVQMIIGCIKEELEEFTDAAVDYSINRGNPEFRKQLCKEWADLQYVVSQAAVYYDIPADAAFNRVHESNMTKVIDGKVVFRDDGKILKPDTYRAPDMGGL